MGGDFKMINDNAQEEMEELVQDIMKHKSVSLLEAASIANKFSIYGIKPKSKEFDEEMRNVKTLWED